MCIYLASLSTNSTPSPSWLLTAHYWVEHTFSPVLTLLPCLSPTTCARTMAMSTLPWLTGFSTWNTCSVVVCPINAWPGGLQSERTGFSLGLSTYKCVTANFLQLIKPLFPLTQKENTGSFVRTKWNDLCKALSPIHQSREKIQQTFMDLSTSLVEFRLFSRSVLKICGSQSVCHRELIGMPSYVFSFQGTHGDIGHLTTITINIFGL